MHGHSLCRSIQIQASDQINNYGAASVGSRFTIGVAKVPKASYMGMSDVSVAGFWLNFVILDLGILAVEFGF